jgi:hypothetical protein
MSLGMENPAAGQGDGAAPKIDLAGASINPETKNAAIARQAKRSKAGKQARQRGAGEERTIKRALQDEGLAAEKVSAMYKAGADLSISLLGRDHAVGVILRKNDFARLYVWFVDRDFLIVRADRKERLVVIPFKLVIEIAKRAEGIIQ